MVRQKRPLAAALIAAGLVGMAVYSIAVRSAGAALGGDTVHGVWVGACVGLEVVGVSLLLKRRTGRAA
jgi:hypothetical protein